MSTTFTSVLPDFLCIYKRFIQRKQNIQYVKLLVVKSDYITPSSSILHAYTFIFNKIDRNEYYMYTPVRQAAYSRTE